MIDRRRSKKTVDAANGHRDRESVLIFRRQRVARPKFLIFALATLAPAARAVGNESDFGNGQDGDPFSPLEIIASTGGVIPSGSFSRHFFG